MPCEIIRETKFPRNERSRGQKFPGTFVLRERKGPRTKGPRNKSSSKLSFSWNECSRERKFPIETIHSWERKVLGTKSPGTPIPMHTTDLNTGTESFRSRANSLPGANRPIGPWPIRSLALSFPGPFAPWSFPFLEVSLHGTFTLGA